MYELKISEIENEREMIELVRSGDREALETLSLVVEIAVNRVIAHFECKHLDSDSIRRAVQKTIIESVDQFDAQREVSFLYYVSWKVKHALHELMLRQMNPGKQEIFYDQRLVMLN